MNEPLVFVRHSIMLGDADDDCTGFAVLTESHWNKQVALWNQYLEAIDAGEVEIEYKDYIDTVTLSDYKVQSCTLEEAETIKKFFIRYHLDKEGIFAEDGWYPLTYWLPDEWVKENR